MNIIFKPECKTEIIEPTYDLPIIGEPISKTGASANNSNAYGVIVGIIGDGSSRRVRVMTEGYIDYDKVKENYMEYTDEAINALTGITLCSGGKLPTGVQPDWNKNDDTKQDYVKNRPFYAEDTVETVLLEEQAVTFTTGESDTSFNFMASPEDINHIKVTWDGTEYICIPQIKIYNNGDFFIEFGNKFIDDNRAEDTGEPFYYNGDVFYTESSADSHQIKVSKLSNKVIQIEPIYIPNSNIRNGLGWLSTEEGDGTKASGKNSHVEGKYNIEDTANKYAHIIGNGTSSKRHNCFMVGWDGAIYVQASDNTNIMMKLTIKSDGTISAEQATV